jgi:hypothetical protein
MVAAQIQKPTHATTSRSVTTCRRPTPGRSAYNLTTTSWFPVRERGKLTGFPGVGDGVGHDVSDVLVGERVGDLPAPPFAAYDPGTA